MANSLQVLINFDENITRNQLQKYYYYSWKKKIPNLIKYFLFILLLIFILDSLFGNKSRIDFLKFSGILFGIYCLIQIIFFFYSKANYSIKTDKFITELKSYHPVTELYFDEKSLYIKNEQYDIRSVWKKISYNISDKILIINFDLGTPFTYLISEEETEQYQNILIFLKDKSKLKNN
ncbi:hypothetical protein ACTJIV_14550 [Chryseobacterium sp. 22532]|uniref:hypothetical protein n=1 Tax=Chryseobacterium sp. 22532 TaxID=3453938 RepID=UPI003F861623